MRKLALITSFCDTNDKVDILIKNIKKLKSLGVDVMLISPLVMSSDVIEICDFYFSTKENPILNWPVRANTFWLSLKNIKNEKVYLHRDEGDYGWAALYQTKKAAQIAITYDYDIFYHMIYDLNIDDNIINDILSNVVNRTYHRIDPSSKTKWNVNLHFLPLDKNLTRLISNSIKKEDYISFDGFAENLIEKILKPIGIAKSKFPVTDLIRYFDGNDERNHTYSKNKNYKIFFSRKDGCFDFITYDVEKPIIKIVVNGDVINYQHTIPVSLNINKLDSFIVYTEEGKDDYTDVFNSIVRNVIEIK
jgi:hypothetical protein